MMQFDWPVQVYYEDTDAGGVVYHSQYLNFMERARTEFLRNIGFMQTALKDELGILFVVRDIQIRFRKPAKFDDVLNVDTRLLNVGRSLLEFEQNIYRGDEHLIAAKVEVVCIGAESFKPTSIPQEMLSQFKF
ncbi:MAG: tol-pal system-associated acyl-CoA thioesterase [Methylophilaceae bacterium]|jgi:acyl-CoA thioester hydrolase|nr:tol-pal system-associated acyl-CoA thioesterase [Methylophilaceae bacterium]NCA26923.1 tol-pal system-associated acyl-CoA thioesterase [Methylophilaceae bacterium]